MHYGAITHFPGDWNHLVDLVRHNAQEKSDMVMIINNRSTSQSSTGLAARNEGSPLNSILCLPGEVCTVFGGGKGEIAVAKRNWFIWLWALCLKALNLP